MKRTLILFTLLAACETAPTPTATSADTAPIDTGTLDAASDTASDTPTDTTKPDATADVADTTTVADTSRTTSDTARTDTTTTDSATDTTPGDATKTDTAADIAVADIAATDSAVTDASTFDTPPDAVLTDAKMEDLEPSGIGGPCSTEQSCKNFPCLAPGQSPGCGICKKGDGNCATDADCKSAGPKFICKPVPCSCDGAAMCVAGCAGDDACKVGEFCAPTGNCVPLVCKKLGDDDQSCPANFTCANPSNPKCQRKPCSKSGDCAKWSGTCVNGLCYDKPGQCMPPPP
jgi:hypothetical protein